MCIDVLSFPTFCSPISSEVDLSQYPCLSELDLADYSRESSHNTIDVLVGSDFYWALVTGEIIKMDNGLVAISSKLGWLLSGPSDHTVKDAITHTQLSIVQNIDSPFSESEEDRLLTAVKRFWEVESVGTCEQSKISDHDSSEPFLQNLAFKEDHYEVSLPWTRDPRDVPNHFLLCKDRLKQLQRKLLKKPEVMKEYQQVIDGQLEKGIIEVCNPSDTLSHPNQHDSVYYMPHHPVIRQDRATTKVPVVYDGSAKSKDGGFSLNDCLQTGPNLIPKLFNVLVKLRSYSIALTADIEKAFLMIRISEHDRDSL